MCVCFACCLCPTKEKMRYVCFDWGLRPANEKMRCVCVCFALGLHPTMEKVCVCVFVLHRVVCVCLHRVYTLQRRR